MQVGGLPQICISATWLAQKLLWVPLPVSSVIVKLAEILTKAVACSCVQLGQP